MANAKTKTKRSFVKNTFTYLKDLDDNIRNNLNLNAIIRQSESSFIEKESNYNELKANLQSAADNKENKQKAKINLKTLITDDEDLTTDKVFPKFSKKCKKYLAVGLPAIIVGIVSITLLTLLVTNIIPFSFSIGIAFLSISSLMGLCIGGGGVGFTGLAIETAIDDNKMHNYMNSILAAPTPALKPTSESQITGRINQIV